MPGMTDREQPGIEPDHATKRGALSEISEANSEATWGDTDGGRAWIPGVVSGDVGPKGKMAAQLRHTSRSERAKYGEVPYGVNAPGTGRFLIAAMGGIVLVLAAIVALIVWLAS